MFSLLHACHCFYLTLKKINSKIFQWNLSFVFLFFFANLSCRPMEEGNEMLNYLGVVGAEVGISECFVCIIGDNVFWNYMYVLYWARMPLH